MMHTDKTIAVLLTVFNRKETTLRSLKNLFTQDLPDGYRFAVYLTDDGCTDGTPEAVAKDFPQVNIVKGNGTLFWNRGMIEAWKEASKTAPDFYLLLNDDTFLLDGAIENMINKSESKNHESVIVGSTVDSKRDKLTYGGRRKKKFSLITDISQEKECDTFNANIVLIPKYVYERIGMLDPVFHHANGDYDYGFRVTEFGLKCVLCDTPAGICDLHSSKPKWCDPHVKLTDRLDNLYKPGGNGSNPFELFILKRRHYGLSQAVTSFVTSHVHAIFPSLWRIKRIK